MEWCNDQMQAVQEREAGKVVGRVLSSVWRSSLSVGSSLIDWTMAGWKFEGQDQRWGHFVAGVCYRIPDQDEQVDSAWAWKRELQVNFLICIIWTHTSFVLKALFTYIKLAKETTNNNSKPSHLLIKDISCVKQGHHSRLIWNSCLFLCLQRQLIYISLRRCHHYID